jgi:hypothetical protein
MELKKIKEGMKMMVGIWGNDFFYTRKRLPKMKHSIWDRWVEELQPASESGILEFDAVITSVWGHWMV